MNDEHNRETRTSALSMDEKLLSLLDAPRWKADLHSCFDRALNLVDDGGNLLVLLPAARQNGPHRIILDLPGDFSFKWLSLTRGERFFSRERKLVNAGASVTVDFSHSSLWNAGAPGESPVLLTPGELRAHRGHLLALLGEGADEEDAGFLSAMNAVMEGTSPAADLVISPLYDRLARLCATLLRGIISRDCLVIEEALPRFLGLGRGLTPSGDDVLCGLVATLHCTRAAMCSQNHMAGEIMACFSRAVAEKREATTFLSAHFLTWMVEGRVSEDMQQLVASLCFRDAQAPGPRIAGFMNLGCSSGRDMMLGVAMAMTLLINSIE